MNWRISSTAKGLAKAEVQVEQAEGEDAPPSKELVGAARSAANTLAKALGGEVHVEVYAHETTVGDGFRPGHVVLTTSRLDPERDTS